jgi:hypothetical protein
MPDQHALPMHVAVLGTDAIVAAGPIEPAQLWRACESIGFDFVVPVSWGEELIASWLSTRVSTGTGRAAVIATCPKVDERLQSANVSTHVLRTVSPPVACARYVRAAFHPRPVHVTYVGACPGAVSDEVDAHLLPAMLLARFVEAGVDAAMQPKHFDGRVPPERARYASLPGGAPAAEWLGMQGVQLIEAAPITVDTVTQGNGSEPLLIDLAASCFCTCARNRPAAARLEPARTFVPVVMNLGVSVGEDAEPEPVPSPPAPTMRPAQTTRAKFAENGLSAGEATPMPVSGMTEEFSAALEPW